MAKVLNSKDFTNQLIELSQMEWDVSESRGFPVLQQTKRNAVKQELLGGIKTTLEQLFERDPLPIANVYLTDEGVAVEIENDSVRKTVEDGNGMITMIIDIKFKSLDYDAMIASDSYMEERAQKEAERAAKAEAKARKIAADKARRAAEKGEKQ